MASRVQGRVRVADQHVGPQDAAQAAGDTGREGDHDGLAVGEPEGRAAHDPPQLLGDRRGRVGIGLRQHDQELLATVPARGVDGPDVGRQQRAHVAQHQVAGRVSMRVVEPLEVVEVGHDHRQRVPVAGRTGQLLVHEVQDGLPVGDAGQGIHRRQPPRVGDAVRERAEGGAQPRIPDAGSADGDQRSLVLGVREVLDEGREPPVLATHDDGGEPGRAGERADESDERAEHQRDGDRFQAGFVQCAAVRSPDGRTRVDHTRGQGGRLPWGEGPARGRSRGGRFPPAPHEPTRVMARKYHAGPPGAADSPVRAPGGAPVPGPARDRRRRPGATPRTVRPRSPPARSRRRAPTPARPGPGTPGGSGVACR